MNLFTCIIFFEDKNKTPAKYRNIINLEKFKTFAATTNGHYFNVYDKLTRGYIERVYFK
jgi:hypothetical protein